MWPEYCNNAGLQSDALCDVVDGSDAAIWRLANGRPASRWVALSGRRLAE